MATETGSQLQNINEQLYKQNAELAVKNKTLSLLRELYQISILTLEPDELANKVSKIILDTLDMELVSIYTYTETEDTLIPIALKYSDNFKDGYSQTIKTEIVTRSIENASKNQVFRTILDKKEQIFRGLIELWPNLDLSQYNKLEELCHIKSSLAYPLIIEGKVIGILLISLNRHFGDFSVFEKESLGSIVNVIAVALDRATLDKKLKIANTKLKELDRRKTEFVSIASHQLRSPLTAIKGYSSMILEGSFGETSEKIQKAVDIIFQSSNRLVNVIEDFLNVTRIELGKMKYELSEFNVRDLATDVVKELKEEAGKKNISLSISSDTGPHNVYGDTGKLRQVISNMVDNSLKYTPAGSIKLEVSHIGNAVRIQVIDTGIGLAPGEEDKLFQKFVRADGAGKVNIKGTGLGMYVARQIVEAHLGKIFAKSPGKGKGSVFTVELPDANLVDRSKVGISKPESNS